MSLTRFIRHSLLPLLLLSLLTVPAQAGQQQLTQQILHILDYVSVDYPAMVVDGQILDAAEYAEQQEFSKELRGLIAQLPKGPERAPLLTQAASLATAIDRRAPSDQVTRLCAEISAAVIKHYGVVLAPTKVPSLTKGRALYMENCQGCHGADGFGNGPQAAGLVPPPNDFHERGRQARRSVYGLYSTISLGVDGTAMQGYANLSDDQRWALAFFVGNFFGTNNERAQGEVLWEKGGYQKIFPGLTRVTAITPEEVEKQHGPDGLAVLAYLRNNPKVLASETSAHLAYTRQKLNESFIHYRAGDQRDAYQLAIAAYLEGYELTESALSIVDPTLRKTIEEQMAQFRSMIKQRAPIESVAAQLESLQGLLNKAEDRLQNTSLSPVMSATSALIILLREGVEALLVLSAIIAFLLKTGRRDALPYVHAGWISALALGVLTWFAASHFISISGAGRELTEGVTALFAAAMLVYVGYWLHSAMQAERWKQFLHSKIQGALDGRNLWTLVLVAFLAVYREVFETVLFYETLWLQAGPSNHIYLIGGLLGAVAILAGLAWAIFRYSARLPLRLFFSVNSVLIYTLAIIFAGKGVAALQEAGKLPINPISFPQIDILGIYPNLQSLGLQVTLLALAIVWLSYKRINPQ